MSHIYCGIGCSCYQVQINPLPANFLLVALGNANFFPSPHLQMFRPPCIFVYSIFDSIAYVDMIFTFTVRRNVLWKKIAFRIMLTEVQSFEIYTFYCEVLSMGILIC